MLFHEGKMNQKDGASDKRESENKMVMKEKRLLGKCLQRDFVVRIGHKPGGEECESCQLSQSADTCDGSVTN